MQETKKISPEQVWRYERKYLVEGLDTHRVLSLVKLHPMLFVEPYPPRFVNNIYLDTPAMDYYHENISGVKDRRKVRIRWYGELFSEIQNPVLEFKIKDGLVGTKKSFPLTGFVFDKAFNCHTLRLAINQSGLPENILFAIRDLEPVLVNRYYRWYYATTDNRFRTTVDADMHFYHVENLRNSFRHHQGNYLNRVVELKYDREFDPQAGRVAQYFPFPVSKNSKYVEGIERVYL